MHPDLAFQDFRNFVSEREPTAIDDMAVFLLKVLFIYIYIYIYIYIIGFFILISICVL